MHVVSMLLVIMSFGDKVFQSSDVSGAVCSGVFELDKSARGVSFCGGGSLVLTEEDLVTVLETFAAAAEAFGRDQRRRWSPEVASKSVELF